MDGQSLHTYQQQVKSRLWIRTYALTCATAFVMLAFFASNLLSASRKHPLDSASEKINPNTASIGSLVRLPGIGNAKALDIIHYRDTMQGDRPAFKMAGDMENIKGIGPKTVEKLRPYLIFEYDSEEQRDAP